METEQPKQIQPPVPGSDINAPRPMTGKIILVVAVVVLLVMVIVFMNRDHGSTANVSAPVIVGVVKVTREDLFNQVTIPAEFRPYMEVELHAKVSGYVDQMKVDFGDKVKSGQLLATLEVPELRDQLHSAVAMQQRAEADYTNAHLLYTRLQTVNEQHPNLVAQQELDTAQARDSSAVAAIAAAKADTERYQTLVNYTKITAPFDGIITKRYADPGSLIQGGTSSDAQSVVRVSDNYKLRLDFPVSVKYVKDIRNGDTVVVRVDSLSGKPFTGTITRSSDKVNEDTRTMVVEVEVANPDLEIVPGMYAYVELKVQRLSQALVIPTQVVGGERNPTVYVVNDNSEIEARPITLGLETPDKYEVASGLKEGEQVMFGNRAFVHPGQKVETKPITLSAVP